MYQEGYIPNEDEKLKKLLISANQFIVKVETANKFSG